MIKTEIDVTQCAALPQQHRSADRRRELHRSAHRLRISGTRAASPKYEAEKIIIATGTKPAGSPKVPINNRNIINSDQILQMPEIPKTLIVVGGGVIGVEYTCMFATLGVRVILIEKRPRLLEFADAGNGRSALLSPARSPRDHASE